MPRVTICNVYEGEDLDEIAQPVGPVDGSTVFAIDDLEIAQAIQYSDGDFSPIGRLSITMPCGAGAKNPICSSVVRVSWDHNRRPVA